ncbi:MAG: chemotaxis response regulator protein-glutamate methylesterase [Hyphomicrobium sp.]
MKKIRVLIVDDSALMRRFLRDVLSSDEQIEVVDTAADPIIAREKIKRLDPDVITLDVQMPNMSGLDFLERLMRLRPTPVIMFSSLTYHEANESLRALALGAVDVVAKPVAATQAEWDSLASSLIEKVKLAASAHLQVTQPGVPPPRSTSGAGWTKEPHDRIVAIGASTGGVQALQTVLGALPASCPPVLISQHMPPNFTRSFTQRLDKHCAVSVCEAVDGAPIQCGRVYVAPGDRHILLERRSNGYVCRLRGGAEYNGYMPSVDLMFQSVASAAGPSSMGIVLTGMGKDGAAGLLQIHEAGGITVSQDEASSLIYGMPKAAVAIGAAQIELPIERMASLIVETTSNIRRIKKPERMQA